MPDEPAPERTRGLLTPFLTPVVATADGVWHRLDARASTHVPDRSVEPWGP